MNGAKLGKSPLITLIIGMLTHSEVSVNARSIYYILLARIVHLFLLPQAYIIISVL